MSKRILVTGGAGFIGSAVVRHIIRETRASGAGGRQAHLCGQSRFARARVERSALRLRARRHRAMPPKMRELFESFRPDAVMHLAAESHVDRSIDGPGEFIQTNVVGTFTLLQAALGYWRALPAAQKDAFRFHHISTDEVFGSLGDEGLFCETTAYDPRSPYSASKAASDHLVRAWHHTYGLPVVADQLLEQLRPVSLPREADPADHHQCARRPEAAGLRQGRQRARLALCRRSRPRAARGRDRGHGRRDLLRRRAQREDQSRRRRGDLRADGRACAEQPRSARASR